MEILATYWRSYVVDLRLIEIGTLFFIAWQVMAIRKQTHLDHERSRRERALETLRWFVNNLKPEHHRIGFVLDGLSDDALRSLHRGEALVFSDHYKEHVIRILSTRMNPKEIKIEAAGNSSSQLNEVQVGTLRFICMNYLNLIEMALAPMMSGIADEKIMKMQMSPYFINSDASPRLKRIREVWGRGALPCSFAFHEKLSVERKPTPWLQKLTRSVGIKAPTEEGKTEMK